MQLQVLLTCERGRVIALDEGTHVLGRSGTATVSLLSEIVSRAHARIEVGPSALRVVDLASVNGTFIDGARIDGEASAMPGNVLLFGDVAVRVHDAGVPVPPLHPRDGLPAYLGIVPEIMGSLEECPAATLLRHAVVRKKTGVLALTSSLRTARITFVRGEICGVEIDGSRAADPALGLTNVLGWRGTYELRPASELPTPLGVSLDSVLPALR